MKVTTKVTLSARSPSPVTIRRALRRAAVAIPDDASKVTLVAGGKGTRYGMRSESMKVVLTVYEDV